MKLVYALRGRLAKNYVTKNDGYLSTRNSYEDTYPWLKGENLLYLGEIENMKGHGIFVRNDGKVHYGYHIDDFIEVTAELEDSTGRFEDTKDNKIYFCLELSKLLELTKNNKE
jgi:hypothetical protein